ncbi:MAG: CotH kinase family protein [Lachnospiraceae bacterium]|nr:CotH kinase family protein [Lachnospiraceae bacterium]
MKHVLDTIDRTQMLYHKELENDFQNWEKKFNWCSDEMKAIEDYDAQISYMKEWIEKRMKWLYTIYNK